LLDLRVAVYAQAALRSVDWRRLRPGWGKDLDAVSGGELCEEGRVGRDGYGQAQVRGWFADGSGELVEAARAGHDDDPARPGVGDGEAVRDGAGHEDQHAGPGLPWVVPAEAAELAVQDEQRFVAVVVEVRRRGEAGRYPVIEDAQLAMAVAAADLGDGQGVEEQNGCPSSAATTNPPVRVWFPACMACLLVRSGGRQSAGLRRARPAVRKGAGLRGMRWRGPVPGRLAPGLPAVSARAWVTAAGLAGSCGSSPGRR
jgi:hypothetical protein